VTRIEAIEGDITQLQVDAISNAANTALAHGGGVAGAISRAGGPTIQDESDRLAPIGLGGPSRPEAARCHAGGWSTRRP
jgi:O-acetyl-ADP-ribose deacetylase (regulator of RNase III)